jgi:hypothetical protein
MPKEPAGNMRCAMFPAGSFESQRALLNRALISRPDFVNFGRVPFRVYSQSQVLGYDSQFSDV